jgi:hypothetical protein
MVDIDAILTAFLQEVAADLPPGKGIHQELAIDSTRGVYLLMHTGWSRGRRVYGCLLHFAVRDGKVWVEHNGTEIEVADELEKRGIAKASIVFGFHPPDMRQYTEFAIG